MDLPDELYRNPREWPYPIHYEKENEVVADVLVLGGGIAGCWAAISAAKKGMNVVLVEKGNVTVSGAGGSGCDHWLFAPTNPSSKITPEELTKALIENHGGWNCGINRYIQCRESYDTFLELEQMGVKIRDNEDIFKGSEFRDEKTKLLFVYDYENKFSLRVWGTGIKPILAKECRRLGVMIFNRTMATSLLTEGGSQGTRVVGATGVNTRTGEFYTFNAKATILCLARPDRQWVFSTELSGFLGNDPGVGDGHAMAWKAGAEFTLMERSGATPGPFGYLDYGTGRHIATWRPCSIVDSNGKEVPWVDRDGKILSTISERNRSAPGQKFFLDGGGAGIRGLRPPLYEFKEPNIIQDIKERIASGEFTLPLYADLPSMPEHERRVIFGLMLSQEGKTKIPVYANYTNAGFDPDKDMLQCYTNFFGVGPPQWRTTSFCSGGLVVDWDLKTSLEGLYTAGTQVFAAEDHSNAATTGKYAGRKASEYAKNIAFLPLDRAQVEYEKNRVYAPIKRKNGIEWKELNAGICRVMQDYCGEFKNEALLTIGLNWLSELKKGEASEAYARNPHELMRTLEAITLLTVGEMIMHASLSRRASSRFLDFKRLDYPETDPHTWQKWITTKVEDGNVKTGELPLDYWGLLEENYQAHCGL